MGVHVGGQDPINNVGAHLSIDPRFTNVGRGVWGLATQDDTEPGIFGTEPEGESDSLFDNQVEDDSDEEDKVAW